MTSSKAEADHIALVEQNVAHNYRPLPVVIATGRGAWVEDVDGKRYLDMLVGHSVLNFGHNHPRLIAAAKAQLDRLTLVNRAMYDDQLGPMCAAVAKLAKMEAVLPMNTGAEGVETAIKTVRKWGYEKKKVPEGKAKIIACEWNFHGRTTTIVGFSSDPNARRGFGPFAPGFELVPHGDAEALERAIDDNTVAFLFEPIQGSGGIVVPPDGYLKQVRSICSRHNVLMVADEIQSGLARTGYTFACEHEGVQPDVYILGKGLGAGIVPISAVVSRWDILDVFTPGTHGSTFGGNPLACAIAREVVALLETGEFQEHATKMGAYMMGALRAAPLSVVREVRGRGLWIGVEIKNEAGPARPFCERLLREGLLCIDTRGQTIQFAPPLCITRDDIDWALERVLRVLA